MNEQYFITLETELGVVVSETSKAQSDVTRLTPLNSVLPLPMLLT
jgi:hypothetical protein